MNNSSADLPVARWYSPIFYGFLAILAFLWRDNSELAYPQALYLLAALLALNLWAGMKAHALASRRWAAAAAVLANCALISAILSFSGGAGSNLWVLFLLPVYTACLLLRSRDVALVAAGVAAFNVAFHLGEDWGTAGLFAVSVKSALLLFAAAATWSVAERGRRTADLLQDRRRDLRRLEALLRDQEARLTEAHQLAEAGWMASAAAHDLNTPLAIILGTVDVLRENLPDDVDLRSDLDRIARSVHMAKRTATGLLALARRQTAEKAAPCDVHQVLDSVLDLCGADLARRGIRVRSDFRAERPLATGHAHQLQRLFMNLVSNAASAMERGGELRILTEASGERLQVVVEDDGPGIPERLLGRLFTPFTTGKPDGNGLGLYLCREIAMQHGGSLLGDNRPEGGARFTLLLPALEPVPAVR